MTGRAKLAKVDEKDMMIFLPGRARAQLTVFTHG